MGYNAVYTQSIEKSHRKLCITNGIYLKPPRYHILNKKSIVMILCVSLFVSAILSTVSSAEGEDWPMFQHDVKHTGYSTSTAPGTNNTLWNFSTSDYVSSSPVVVDGKVYIGSDDGNLYCLDAEDGHEIWNTTVGNVIWKSSPAVADGRVYMGGGDLFSCLNAEDGSIVWKYVVGSRVSSSPAVFDDKVYFGSWDRWVYCLDATPDDNDDEGILNPGENYDLIWKFKTNNLVLSSPAVYDKMVYIGSQDTKIYCLYASNGTEIWNYPTNGSVQSSPAIYKGKIYVGSDDYRVYCLYANNGTELWNYPTTSIVRSSPAIGYGKVYIGCGGYIGKIYCLDATTGLPAWDSPFVTGDGVTSSPAIADGKVYVGSNDNKVYCLDADDGAKIWEYETGSSIDYSSPAVANGKIYIGSQDKKVYCFEDEGNQPPDKPSTPSGITSGYNGIEYTYTTTTTDPDNDDLYYWFDWGDNTNSGWLGVYSSGTLATRTHMWDEPGSYNVKVKAKDSQGEESDWSDPLTTNIVTYTSEEQLIITAPSSVTEGETFDVTVAADGEFIEDAEVTFNSISLSTDENGLVTFTAPSVDADIGYPIIAVKEGYFSAEESIVVVNQEVVKGLVSGRVIDSMGSSISNARVCIEVVIDISECTFTDVNGFYSMEVLPDTYTITVSKSGYVTHTEEITVSIERVTDLDVALEKIEDQIGPLPDEDIDVLADHAVQTAIDAGYVGAKITVEADEPVIERYSDVFDIMVEQKADSIEFTVGADEGTPGTFFVVFISDEVFSTSDFVVTFDDETIERMSISNFLNPEEMIGPAYVFLLAKEGCYLGVYVPGFSEHTITISLAEGVEIIGGVTAVILYIAISAIVLLVFFIPMITNIIRRRRYF